MIQGNQQTTTIDTWPYYEFEDYIRLLNDRNEEERKAREDGDSQQSSLPDYSKMNNMASNFKVPSFKMPKL